MKLKSMALNQPVATHSTNDAFFDLILNEVSSDRPSMPFNRAPIVVKLNHPQPPALVSVDKTSTGGTSAGLTVSEIKRKEDGIESPLQDRKISSSAAETKQQQLAAAAAETATTEMMMNGSSETAKSAVVVLSNLEVKPTAPPNQLLPQEQAMLTKMAQMPQMPAQQQALVGVGVGGVMYPPRMMPRPPPVNLGPNVILAPGGTFCLVYYSQFALHYKCDTKLGLLSRFDHGNTYSISSLTKTRSKDKNYNFTFF